MKKLWQKIKCLFGLHEWTSKAMEEIKPNSEELKNPSGFWNYAEMYCKYCKTISKLSLRNYER